MQYKDGAKVYLEDGGDAGRLERVVIDPRTDQVTDIVVRRGMISPQRKLVPATMIDYGSEDEIHLKSIPGGWDELPPFEETEYRLMDARDALAPEEFSGTTAPIIYSFPPTVPVSGGIYPPGPVVDSVVPAVQPENASSYARHTRQNIGEGQVALKEGAKVVSRDGADLGAVEQLVTRPETGEVTHFVISRGLFLKEHKLVPYDWVDEIFESEVRLGVNARFVEHLPDYQEPG